MSWPGLRTQNPVFMPPHPHEQPWLRANRFHGFISALGMQHVTQEQLDGSSTQHGHYKGLVKGEENLPKCSCWVSPVCTECPEFGDALVWPLWSSPAAGEMFCQSKRGNSKPHPHPKPPSQIPNSSLRFPLGVGAWEVFIALFHLFQLLPWAAAPGLDSSFQAEIFPVSTLPSPPALSLSRAWLSPPAGTVQSQQGPSSQGCSGISA